MTTESGCNPLAAIVDCEGPPLDTKRCSVCGRELDPPCPDYETRHTLSECLVNLRERIEQLESQTSMIGRNP